MQWKIKKLQVHILYMTIFQICENIIIMIHNLYTAVTSAATSSAMASAAILFEIDSAASILTTFDRFISNKIIF